MTSSGCWSYWISSRDPEPSGFRSGSQITARVELDCWGELDNSGDFESLQISNLHKSPSRVAEASRNWRSI